MLPGSLGVSSQPRPLGSLLENTGRLHNLELLGHAGRPIPAALSVRAMAADVALYLAHVAPARVRGVCNIAAKVVMDERAARRGLLWARDNDLAKPGSATHLQLEASHPGVEWRDWVKLLAALYKDLGEKAPLTDSDFQALNAPCLTICGDRDPMVPWGEAAGLALRIPRSHCFTFVGRAHPLDDLPLDLVGATIRGWLQFQQ